jgi:hypothetical protein
MENADALDGDSLGAVVLVHCSHEGALCDSCRALVRWRAYQSHAFVFAIVNALQAIGEILLQRGGVAEASSQNYFVDADVVRYPIVDLLSHERVDGLE